MTDDMQEFRAAVRSAQACGLTLQDVVACLMTAETARAFNVAVMEQCLRVPEPPIHAWPDFVEGDL